MNSIQHTDVSFFQFVFKDRTNRRYLWIALIGTVVQFVVFKMFYPFPDFFSDSYSYIYAAYMHLDINLWPIGYSKFLAAFHRLTHSDTALVGFQYFIFEIGCALFLFSLLYFFNLGRTTRTILYLFLFFNPLFLYLCNYVNSDPIFATLSVVWLTQLLWVLYKPQLSQIIIHAFLLFACFTVRNNAYYYPLISILAFSLSKYAFWAKIIGAVSGLIFIIPFILHTREEAYKITGTRQFSLFTGWQLANNALYMYDKIDVDNTKLKDLHMQELDKITKTFLSKIPTDFDYRGFLNSYVGNYFIRQPEAPLKQYIKTHFNITDEFSSIKAWGIASNTFGEYGNYLIRNNPTEYFRYFILQNTKNYFLPPLEKLEIYNVGNDDIWPIGQQWFHYSSSRIRSVSKKAQGTILFLFPPVFMLVNFLVIGCLLWFMSAKKFRVNKPLFNRIVILIGTLLFANFCFCVSATMIVFRYQIFPMIVALTLSLLLLEQIEAGKIKPKEYHNE